MMPDVRLNVFPVIVYAGAPALNVMPAMLNALVVSVFVSVVFPEVLVLVKVSESPEIGGLFAELLAQSVEVAQSVPVPPDQISFPFAAEARCPTKNVNTPTRRMHNGNRPSPRRAAAVGKRQEDDDLFMIRGRLQRGGIKRGFSEGFSLLTVASKPLPTPKITKSSWDASFIMCFFRH